MSFEPCVLKKKYLLSIFVANKRQQISSIVQKYKNRGWDSTEYYTIEEFMQLVNFILEKTQFVQKETLVFSPQGERYVRKWESEYIAQAIRIAVQLQMRFFPKQDLFWTLQCLNIHDETGFFVTQKYTGNLKFVPPPSRIPFFFSAKASYVLALTHEDFFLSARQSKIHERKLHQIVLSYL